MSDQESLRAIVPMLIELGKRSDLDTLAPDGIPPAIRAADQINRMGWRDWSAESEPLSYTDLVSLLKAIVIVERVLNWKGGSVAAVIWIGGELRRRNDPATPAWENWAAVRTRNPHARLSRMESIDTPENRQLEVANRRARDIACAEQNQLLKDEHAAKIAAAREAHAARMTTQREATDDRRRVLVELAAMSPVARLTFIAEDETRVVSYFPEEYAEVDISEMSVFGQELVAKLIAKTSATRNKCWKRLNRKLREFESAQTSK